MEFKTLYKTHKCCTIKPFEDIDSYKLSIIEDEESRLYTYWLQLIKFGLPKDSKWESIHNDKIDPRFKEVFESLKPKMEVNMNLDSLSEEYTFVLQLTLAYPKGMKIGAKSLEDYDKLN